MTDADNSQLDLLAASLCRFDQGPSDAEIEAVNECVRRGLMKPGAATLPPEYGDVFRDIVQVKIEQRVAAIDLGATLSAEGVSTASLDENGRIVEHAPEDVDADRAKSPAAGSSDEPDERTG